MAVPMYELPVSLISRYVNIDTIPCRVETVIYEAPLPSTVPTNDHYQIVWPLAHPPCVPDEGNSTVIVRLYDKRDVDNGNTYDFWGRSYCDFYDSLAHLNEAAHKCGWSFGGPPGISIDSPMYPGFLFNGSSGGWFPPAVIRITANLRLAATTVVAPRIFTSLAPVGPPPPSAFVAPTRVGVLLP